MQKPVRYSGGMGIKILKKFVKKEIFYLGRAPKSVINSKSLFSNGIG